MSEVKKATRDGFGEEIVALGKQNKDIYVVDIDIGKSCKTGKFREELPKQYFNVGIAEQNGAGVAAGIDVYKRQTEDSLREKIAEILPSKVTRTAPVILVILTEEIVTPTGQTFELEDYGAAVENILLAATALGYATVWLDGMLKLDGKAEKIHRLLSVPQEKTVRAILPIGVPKETGVPREKKSWEERVVYNKFE